MMCSFFIQKLKQSLSESVEVMSTGLLFILLFKNFRKARAKSPFYKSSAGQTYETSWWCFS